MNTAEDEKFLREERAAIREFDAGFPRIWAEVMVDTDDCSYFVRKWGRSCQHYGWSPQEVIDVLVPLIKRGTVVDLTQKSMTVMYDKAVAVYRRGVEWELKSSR